MKTTICSAVCFIAVVSAAPAPLQKRAGIDETILNYALTLEHLENAFYKEGLSRFKAADLKAAGFKDPNFFKNLKKIAADEASHVAVIQQVQAASGFSTTQPCTYNFGITDAKSFIATAAILEGVGVTAYLGAAAQVTDKSLLTAAGSILTTEARHHAFIRNARRQSPFAQAYDTPLDFSQVYSLAAPFITSCPSTNPTLPVTAFPSLAAQGSNLMRGGSVTFKYGAAAQLPSGNVFVAWPTVLGSIFVNTTVDTAARTVTCTIPNGGATGPLGQAYAVLVNTNGTISDSTTIAGPAIVNVVVPYLAAKGNSS